MPLLPSPSMKPSHNDARHAAVHDRMSHPGISAWLAVTVLAFAPVASARQATPAPAEAMAAYRTLDAWIRAWEVPAESPETDPANTAGACVTLRLGGEILGRAAEVGSDGQTIRRAAKRAITEATARAPVPRDALRNEALLEMAARVTIDLQIAGALVPLLGESFDETGASLRPGIDGVAARADEEIGSVFPGVMLTTGLAPGAALRAASAQAGLGPLEMNKLRADHGAIFYRFTTLHLAQPAPGAEPVFLHRGGRVVPMTEVGVAGLRRLAEGIAAHLISHDWPGDEPAGMLGDYDPLRNEYEPLIATAQEQTLAAFALFRFARTPGVNLAAAARASRFAWTILDELAAVAPGETEALTDTTTCAGYVVALLEATDRPPGMKPGAEVGDDAWQRAAESLRALCNADGVWTGDLSQGAQSLAAYALAALALDTRAAQPGDSDRAHAAVRTIFRNTAPGDLPTTMPWLAWAELRLAPADSAIPAGEALRDLRAMLWSRQVSPTAAGPGDEDLVGGVSFSASRNPYPTWHTFRPGAAAATMFGDPRLTNAEEGHGELSRLVLMMRFLSQLTVDDAAMHMLRDRERAIGGVREAVWSSRQPVEASTAGLLAVCELLRAVDSRSRSRNAAPGGEAGSDAR